MSSVHKKKFINKDNEIYIIILSRQDFKIEAYVT